MAKWLKETGKKGEDLAVDYLRRHGYKIIERNFQKGYGEIDIVAQEGDTLVFVEVKTRKSSRFGSPLEAITPWKIKALIRSCQFYKSLHAELPESLRLDVVSVLIFPGGGVERIELVKNITG
ncbi:YraN family protein [Candidatus Microgenomates bacterium]|nr:YraN family protein [Candidatus Microgenomates bacterium]